MKTIYGAYKNSTHKIACSAHQMHTDSAGEKNHVLHAEGGNGDSFAEARTLSLRAVAEVTRTPGVTRETWAAVYGRPQTL